MISICNIAIVVTVLLAIVVVLRMLFEAASYYGITVNFTTGHERTDDSHDSIDRKDHADVMFGGTIALIALGTALVVLILLRRWVAG